MPAALQLRLIPATAPQPARAGYLPGSDTAAWLEEMALHPQGKFYVVPASVEDLEVGGLLILPGEGSAKSALFGPRVLPCVLEHGRVAVPASTRLDPMLTPDEARRLLTYGLYFFHPAMGLVAFEEADAITAASLIVPPLVQEVSWMHAQAGAGQPPALTRVSLALPEDLDDLFGDATDDIGSASPKDLKGKAPLGEKLRDMVKGGLSAAAAGVLGGLMSMFRPGKQGGRAGSTPGGKAGPPPLPGAAGGGGGGGFRALDKLMNWTAEQLAKLERQRESEINRLLKLLESDPDQGLRYALPFGGGDAGRGTAAPGGRLGERNPTYGARGRSGPADAWNLSQQTQWELQKKYRELANREIAEGRFDRAAYIFAELLGDWHAAANTLTRGHRYQEAARIYLDKLSNKPLAAKCLEDGGLLQDAIVLYAEMGHHETCGDLFRRLGREPDAVAAYLKAIQGNDDRLNDARILFDKLQQPALAISVLASGYPHSAQARACLEKHFAYLTTLNAREDALALAASLATPERQMQPALTMAETLAGLHRDHPDGEVRARLATAGLGVIGEALMRKDTAKEKPLLDLVPKFAPSDLLLRRDATRFLDARERAARLKPKQPPPLPASSGRTLMRISMRRLPMDGSLWHHLVSRDKAWLATGHHAGTRQDVWVLGQGDSQTGKLTSASGWGSRTALPALLLPAAAGSVWLPMAPPEQPPRYAAALASDFASMPRTREMLLTRLSWMPGGLLAACPVNTGVWVLYTSASGTIDLAFYSYEGRIGRIFALGWQPPELNLPLFMVAHDEDLFISSGPLLIQVKNGKVVNEMELGAAVSHLTASRPEHPSAVIAVAGSEAVLVMPGKKGETMQIFSSTTGQPPAACFLADGRIAAVDNASGLIYSPCPDARLTASITLPKVQASVVCCCTPWDDHGVAILWQDGLIECFA